MIARLVSSSAFILREKDGTEYQLIEGWLLRRNSGKQEWLPVDGYPSQARRKAAHAEAIEALQDCRVIPRDEPQAEPAPKRCAVTGKIDCTERTCELHYMDAPLRLI